MATCLIAMGSNLGDRTALLEAASAAIADEPDVQVLAQSRWLETQPIGGPSNQPAYLNAAVLIETPLEPRSVLAALQRIELRLGRKRETRWAARTIDLDLILYGSLQIDEADITIPHPRMPFRRFVLEPAVEIAPNLIDPSSGWTVSQLLAHLRKSSLLITLGEFAAAEKLAIASSVAKQLDGRSVSASLDLESELKSSGRQTQRQIKFLDQVVARTKLEISQAPDRWIISDFWLCHLLLMAETSLSTAEFQEYSDHWIEVARTAPRPRIRVLPHLATTGKSKDGNSRDSSMADASIKGLIPGPTLRVRTRDRHEIASEIVAAARASL